MSAGPGAGRSARELEHPRSLRTEGLGKKTPKGYVYAAMTFSVFVEVLSIGVRRKTEKPVTLHEKMTPDPNSEYVTT